MPNFVSLSPNALHVWGCQVENDACDPVGPLKLLFHENVETSFPHLQHLPPFFYHTVSMFMGAKPMHPCRLQLLWEGILGLLHTLGNTPS